MPTSRPPLVLAVCIDALRHGCANWQPNAPYFERFGVPRPLKTPTLDAIGEGSVRFHKAVANAGYTPLSLATTLTGAYSRTHGAVDFQTTCCRPHVKPLFQVFREAGWRTCCVFGPGFLDPLGLTRGADHSVRGEEPLLEMLERGPREPTFAFVHFNDVHHPYTFTDWPDTRADNRDFELMVQLMFGVRADVENRRFIDARGRAVGFDKWDQLVASPVPEAMRKSRADAMFKCYLHGVEKFDQTRLAAFVERLRQAGWWDDAVVALFADHGEIVSPRLPWCLGHGKYLNEQLMRVPLCIKAPGLAPRDVHPLVGLVDLYPTLLELAGIDPRRAELEHKLDGRSLLPAVERDDGVQPHYYHEGWSVLVAETPDRPVLYQRAIRTQRDVKYLFTGDLMDPDEFEPLDEEAFVVYAIERALGERAEAPARLAVREHLRKGVSRRELAAGLTGNVPRYRRFDLSTDPHEEQGDALDPDHPLWREYAGYLKRMVDLRGEPNPRADDRTDMDAAILTRLGELGYVEAGAD